MADVRCTSEDWTERIIGHGVDQSHEGFVWDETVASEYCIRCLKCDTRFVLKVAVLKADFTMRPRLLYEALQTMSGRQILFETIGRTIRQRRPPRTAWDRVLADDDD